ncbi:MAG: hypothetical protein SFY95_06160 [Planctomycetota bacterium]|nr:hypothetical protein [Planctomycetota bacterium]
MGGVLLAMLIMLGGCVGGAELARVERAVDELARQSREQEARFRSWASDSQGSADQAVTIEAERASVRAGERARALEDARSQLAALREQDAESASELGRLLETLAPLASGGGTVGGLGSGVWGLGGMLIGAGVWGIARGWAVRRGLDRVGRALEAAASEEPAVAQALRKRREDLGLIRSAGVRRMLEAPAEELVPGRQRLEAGASAGYRESNRHPAD